jgi:hypothetical protein
MTKSVGSHLLREMRAEVATKDDGRYLIYYSWPSDEEPIERKADRPAVKRRPKQQPWSPETAPDDV